MTRHAGRVPSLRGRLALALTVWSVVWGLAIGVAVWLAATHEVDELLDDALQTSAELLGAIALEVDLTGRHGGVGGHRLGEGQLAWQVVAADGRLLARSNDAPERAWHTRPQPGFDDSRGWRVYGLPLASEGRMLYAAQTHGERREAHLDVALGAVLAALALGGLGHLWLRARLGAELQPLQALSERLEAHRFDDADVVGGLGLGPAERRELQPVHDALEALVSRLAARVRNEQAFSAHAAHALRTPLAGIDAQLAVALREAPPALRDRLARVRGAAGRLQGVVAALLGLFRSGGALQRGPVDVEALVARLPTQALAVEVAPGTRLDADADLLAAALVNLLDNAQRHGARHVWLAVPEPGTLQVRDDGPGVSADRRQALQCAIDAQAYEGTTGLGLLLADRVARAHGGRLRLPDAGAGFIVELVIGP